MRFLDEFEYFNKVNNVHFGGFRTLCKKCNELALFDITVGAAKRNPVEIVTRPHQIPSYVTGKLFLICLLKYACQYLQMKPTSKVSEK